MKRLIVILAALCLAGSVARPASGQEPAAPCTIRLDLSDALSHSERIDVQDPSGWVHYGGSGPVMVSCGDARIRADSLISEPMLNRVRMIGNVTYSDTTRTLDSELLTYFGDEDRIVAEQDVVLTLLKSDSRLEGPHVEFYRSAQGSVDRTVATDRPHLTLNPGPTPEGPGEAFEIDADRAVFIGETDAIASGDVRIHRSDIDATADSTVIQGLVGAGYLFGDPVVTGEDYVLSGDSIRFGFEQQELRTIDAMGNGAVEGEDFELHADLVSARIDGRNVEYVWAFGDGMAVAFSAAYQLAGDSLEFAFTAGRPDSVLAIGSAQAVEIPEAPGSAAASGAEPIDMDLDSGQSWLAGDTIRARFARDPDVSDSGAEEAATDTRLEYLISVGNARSYYAAIRDSAVSMSPSRNYLIGESIEIRFAGGEASEVIGTDAIGVYVDPSEAVRATTVPDGTTNKR